MPERDRFADSTVEIADPEAMEELGRSLGRVLRAGDLLVLTPWRPVGGAVEVPEAHGHRVVHTISRL